MIIDEVHSSQSGERSKELKKSLSKLNIEVDDNGIGIGSDDFSSFFNMGELSYFKMKVWADNPIDVKLKLENIYQSLLFIFPKL